MGKLVIILASDGFKTIGIEDGEMFHRLLPTLGRTPPVGGDIAQGEPEQLSAANLSMLRERFCKALAIA